MNKKYIFVITVIVIVCLGVLAGCSINDVGNEVLSKENFQEITKEYADKNKDSDNVVYLFYAISNNMLKDGLSIAFNTEMTDEEKENETYKNIYGKTINELIKEGKVLVKENNINVKEYKEKLNNNSNSLE